MGDLVRMAREALKQQKGLDLIPAVRPGDLVTWQRDGSKQEGFVDFLHVDPDDKEWAFLSYGETWAVVNLKFVKVVTS